jgi:hypothetical protein
VQFSRIYLQNGGIKLIPGMRQYSAKEKVNLIRNLFKGREDDFALYWQKGNKKGYIPLFCQISEVKKCAGRETCRI